MFEMDGAMSLYLVWGAAMLFAGVLGGIMAGLLGVGGGIVIVPVLYHFLTTMGVDESLRMQVAVATSLTTIIATAISSTRSHYKKGSVDTALLKHWGPAIIVGVILGTAIGGLADGRVLTIVFAVVALIVAGNMILVKDRETNETKNPPKSIWAVLGVIAGSLSAMMGIGGGTICVPVLNFLGYDIRRAVGTSAAIGLIIALPGTIGYAMSGIGVDGRPPFSIGYVNVLAAALLIPMTVLCAPIGARIAHTIPRRALRMCFGLFLAITSARMFYDLLS
ncbi:MAG: sulfite exporter TauE/SafE family protein [Thalassospira sp.]|uniref:sulfite exporter TauE/SafE family protein n=1 Tax=Thalassospira sp. TaxID=1912094 RepID=UPI001B14DDB8|nr:sulfite exporter TauE/SafE family protein [Thalassospira sp.]MBO6579194.1 sulfite exporter TauE/SafE family protein [Thalassospira sp.]MBO6803832.1 sulfite exporter TauE/SafE family protein [Thalassospira sp.]MBO6817750.1 sulfite exporter TauE/SafE family protein [Thalassospira sp.]MBO6888338.1 sulfite exporter TauE/SafE family protein [Thalassospira sp.]